MPDKPLTSDETSSLDLRWRSKRFTTSLSRVPPVPGLYAFGLNEKNHLGLDAERVYVYIGETDNLRRRLEQHQTSREVNEKLRKFFTKHRKAVHCWYCLLPENWASRGKRRKLEDSLIKFFAPRFNSQGKPQR